MIYTLDEIILDDLDEELEIEKKLS